MCFLFCEKQFIHVNDITISKDPDKKGVNKLIDDVI